MENFDFDDNVDFRLTDEESKKNIKKTAMIGLYALLAAVVIVTGAHAIMLVMAQAPATMGAENSLLAKFLNGIRVTFPIVVEGAAIVAGLGFIGAKWRKGQKTAAFGIELVWVLFAAANMITFFRLERSLPLEPWQVSWVDYGLPLSALIAGIFTYSLTRTDPDLKRKDEETAAEEKIKAIKFSSRRDVAISAQRMAIEKQRAWIDFIKMLETKGYSEQQIRFMLQGVPELLIDADSDGRLDLLEPGDSPQPARPTPTRREVQQPSGNYWTVSFINSSGQPWSYAVVGSLDDAKKAALETRREYHIENISVRNEQGAVVWEVPPSKRPTPAPASGANGAEFNYPKRGDYSPE